MESLTNAAKRKKRKTRKRLDEIRKRSRRTTRTTNEIRLDDMYSKNIQNCPITNSRLTLRMFPNAIRSKTITRPALLDLENKPNINLNELVKGAKIANTQTTLTTTTVRIPIDDILGNELFKYKKTDTNNSSHENSLIIKEPSALPPEQNTENKDNFDVFSSMDELINNSPYNSIGTQSVSSLTSSSTQSLPEDNGYNLYEEFMSEVPACLQQNPKLIQQDVMKKTKMLLQNLFIESCYQECENNILKCIKNDTPKTVYFSREVVHDPIDYIRLGHIQQQRSLSDSGSSSRSPLRPASSLAGLTSPADTPLGVISVITHDTPDYTYYPHRLN